MACEDIGAYQGLREHFVTSVIAIDPTGDCQQVKVGMTSPGPVQNDEMLSRFVFAPVHLSKNTGEIDETVILDAFRIGASVNRIDTTWEQALPALHADGETQAERIRIGSGLRPPQPGRQYMGIVQFHAQALREISVDALHARIRIYDTSLLENCLHADLIANASNLEKAFKHQLRVKLFLLARDAGLFLSPTANPRLETSKLGMQIHLP